jgi:hypothetical protein
MAEGEELPPEVKTFIVQALACFDPPSVVVAAVNEDFGLKVSPQRVMKYNPSKASGADLGQELKAVFEATRKKFLEETAEIGIAHRSYRLRRYQRIADRTPNPMLEMAALEAAAKEMGGVFTNEHKLKHSGNIDSAAQVIALVTTDPNEAAKAYQRMLNAGK